MSAPKMSARTIGWFLLAGGLSFAFYVLAWVPGVVPGVQLLSSNVGRFAITSLSAVVTLLATLKLGVSTRLGRQWAFIGVGLASLAVSQGFWAYYQLIMRVPVPSPGVTDIFRFGFYALAGTGILLAGTAYRRMMAMRNEVLASLVLSAFLLVVLYTTIGLKALTESSTSPLGSAIAIAYPVCDVMLLIGPTILLLLVAAKLRFARLAWPWVAVGIGALTFAAADVGFLVLVSQGVYRSGNPVDFAWMLGPVLMATGALIALDVNFAE